MSALSAEFGTCPCGGPRETRTVQVNMTVDGEQITLERVEQGLCLVCTSRVYKASDLEDIEALMGGRAARPLAPFP
jgi:hypothetical protein